MKLFLGLLVFDAFFSFENNCNKKSSAKVVFAELELERCNDRKRSLQLFFQSPLRLNMVSTLVFSLLRMFSKLKSSATSSGVKCF